MRGQSASLSTQSDPLAARVNETASVLPRLRPSLHRRADARSVTRHPLFVPQPALLASNLMEVKRG
jgi:hypothetical protein